MMIERNMRQSLSLVLLAVMGVAHQLSIAAEPTNEEQVAAVFSSETGPYQEALTGLKQGFQGGLPTFFLSKGEPKIPNSARVILIFGSKAALRSYPDDTILIIAMAPGAEVRMENAIEIRMEPEAGTLLSSLRRIQPAMKRLGVLWAFGGFKDHLNELGKVAEARGITIENARVKSSSDLPDHLRSLYGKVDALWIPPDPLLLNATSLPVLVEFSKSNKVPLYVPTGGLVEQGATAAVGTSFRQIGITAGVAARNALKSPPKERRLHAERVELVIGKTAAAQVGLHLSQEALAAADKVLP